MIKNITFLTVLAILFSSCINDPEDQELVNVDSEFKITLSQALTTDGSHFALDITTLFGQECSDNIIISDISNTDNDVNLLIENIVEAGNCEGNNYTAQKMESLVLDNKSYNFSVKLLNSVESKGTLRQTDREYILDMQDVNGILINKTNIKRIPLGYIWGSIVNQSTTEETNDIIDKVTMTLDLKPVDTNEIISGDYGFFTVSETSEPVINIPNLLGVNNDQAFIFSYDGDAATSQQLIYELRENYPSADLKLMDSTGYVY